MKSDVTLIVSSPLQHSSAKNPPTTIVSALLACTFKVLKKGGDFFL
jgi:hypothetical protein